MTSDPLLPLKKPLWGEACNGCGYCCSSEPCRLASEFLGCQEGPCVALEHSEGRFSCGLVRNPLGYLFVVANPNTEYSPLSEAPDSEEGHQLSVQIASALGLGHGCDSEDDDDSARWPIIQKA